MNGKEILDFPIDHGPMYPSAPPEPWETWSSPKRSRLAELVFFGIVGLIAGAALGTLLAVWLLSR